MADSTRITPSRMVHEHYVDLPKQAKRGRRKAIGAVDTSAGRITFVVGYCVHGDKILLTPTELENLIDSTYLRSRDCSQRLLLYLNRSFNK